MFDIGFWELVMVGVIALIVVGPEQLPGLVRTVGRWVGKARYFVNSVQAEINREIKAEELKRILAEQTRIAEIHDLVEETRHNFTATRAEFELRPGSSASPLISPAPALDDIPDDFQDSVSSREKPPTRLW